ncbi:MAG: hypothetical protein ACRD3W_28610, partial [Terriglobales bacterium]
ATSRRSLTSRLQARTKKGSGFIVWIPWTAAGSEGAFEVQCGGGPGGPALTAIARIIHELENETASERI